MSADFYVKQGDLLTPIAATLKAPDSNGVLQVINLTGATVKFHLSPHLGASNTVNAAAVVVSAVAGTVRYDWASGDTDTPGVYDAEWEITYTATGKQLTVPNDGYDCVLIASQLA